MRGIGLRWILEPSAVLFQILGEGAIRLSAVIRSPRLLAGGVFTLSRIYGTVYPFSNADLKGAVERAFIVWFWLISAHRDEMSNCCLEKQGQARMALS